MIIWTDYTRLLQTSSKKPIRAVTDGNGKTIFSFKLDEKAGTFTVEDGPAKIHPAARLVPRLDPSKLLVEGLWPGVRRIVIIDKDGAKETYDLVVRSMVFVPTGASQVIHLASKMAIKRISNENDKLVRVERLPGNKSVKVSGLLGGDALPSHWRRRQGRDD